MRKASELTPAKPVKTRSHEATGDAVLSRKLLDLRRQHKLNQEQVAEEIGISRPSLVGYENGLTMPPVRVLCRFAVFYDTTLDKLVGHLMSEKA